MPPKRSVRIQERGKHWTEEETTRLLDIVQDLLPLGVNDWMNVCNLYNFNRPVLFPARDLDSLRSKFKTLRNVRKSTGDPTIPINVKRAKQIQKQLEGKTSVSTLDDQVYFLYFCDSHFLKLYLWLIVW